MPCPAPEALQSWFAGALTPEEGAPIAAHVAGCEKCRAAVAALPPVEGTQTEAATKKEGKGPAKRAPPEPREEHGALGLGSLVGRYVLVSELGKGGMGAVYAAYDPQLDRKVALKLLHWRDGDELVDTAGAARLQREAQALARVSHPNTVQVFDVGTHQGRVFIAMEHLEGKTLRLWLRDQERSWRQIVEVLRAAGRGLIAVHDAGLVHRDFKPGNVIVTTDGRVKVLDFGLARISSGDGPRPPRVRPPSEASKEAWAKQVSLDTPLTEEGSLSGTPGYLAPELLAGEAATPLSDQFALGVTLYQSLYGKKPFAGGSFEEFGRSLRAGLPEHPPEGAKAPRWLYPIVKRCLAYKPEGRFPTLAAALDALGRDPAKVRRTWAVRGGVALSIGLAALVGTRLSRGAECPSEADSLAGVWSAQTRAAVETRLVASRPESAARVAAALDLLGRRAEAWSKESAAACHAAAARTATHVDLQRTACLKRRGEALQILIDAVSQADPVVVARSDELVDGYLEDASCSDPAQLARLTADDVPPAQAELARALRGKVMRARALDLLERGTEALAQAREVRAQAADAGLRGFEGEALARAASIEVYQGDGVGAAADYGRALQLFLSAGIDDRALRAGVNLVRQLIAREDRLGEARQVLAVAEALWLRLGADEKLELELNDARAALLDAEGKSDEAVRLAERSVELAVRNYGPRSLEVVHAKVALASWQWSLGRVAQSNQLEADAVAIFKALKGPEDPLLATRYVTLGMGLTHEGRRAEGIALLEQGLALARRTLEKNDATTVDLCIELAEALHGRDDARALTLAEEAVAFYDRRTDQASLSGALYTRARALTAAGRTAEALADCERAATLDEGEVDPVGDVARSRYECLGEAHEKRGAVAAALDAWTRAYEVTPKSPLPDVRGRDAFALARALRAAKKYPDKARALAKEALAEYAAFPGYEAERKQIEAFLAQ